MLLNEIVQPKIRKVLCILPGGFHIFHSGHLSVYQYLKHKFPQADVFVASTNNTKERPFPFKEKQFLASQAGIPSDRFVEVVSPYKAIEITEHYNPEDTVLIFALSEKDKDRLGNPLKKDGTPAFMQPYPGSIAKCQPFAKHGYYVVTPTIKFTVLGNMISSASQIREMYKNADDQTRLDIAEDLYPISQQIPKVKKILDDVLGSAPITEAISKSIVPGWLLPDGKNLPITKNVTHHKILNQYGMQDYYEAYNKGWIRISIAQFQSHNVACLEIDRPIKQVENRLEAAAKQLQTKYPEVVAYCGSGSTYGKYLWDGKEFVKIHKVVGISEHIVKLKSGKYRLLSHKGKNLGTFDSRAAAAKHEGEVEYFKHMKESPDYGYSSYFDREDELKKLIWSSKNLLPTGEAVGIYARTPDSSSQEWVARMGLQIEEENGKLFRATIRQTTIGHDWTGTGLGQQLYDHAISYAKKRGCKFFCSDIQRTMDAEGAWKRLSKRYPVEKHTNYYIIDLSKV